MTARALRRAVLAAALLAPAAPAAAGWWEDAAKAREVPLARLREAPDRFRDVTVSLVLRFERALPAPPAAEAFPAAEWLAFAAAPPDASPADGPAKPSERLFVRRGSAEEARLASLARGQEMRVRAVVRDVAAGEPSFEVVWISGPADALSPEEAAAVARADELLAKENAEAAERLLRGVLAGRDLAPPLRADLLRRLARALRARDRLDDAVASLREAVRLAPADAATALDLARAEDLRSRRAPPPAAAAAPVVPARLAPPRDLDGQPVAAQAPAAQAPAATQPAAPGVPAAVATQPPAATPEATTPAGSPAATAAAAADAPPAPGPRLAPPK